MTTTTTTNGEYASPYLEDRRVAVKYDPIILVEIHPSIRETERFAALFNNEEIVHFGCVEEKAFIDHKDKRKRSIYFNQNLEYLDTDPFEENVLSWYLLWQSEDLEVNRQKYNMLLEKWCRGEKHFPLYTCDYNPQTYWY